MKIDFDTLLITIILFLICLSLFFLKYPANLVVSLVLTGIQLWRVEVALKRGGKNE